MMRTRTRVAFVMLGDFDPAELRIRTTAGAIVEPTRMARAGEAIGRTARLHPESLWEHRSALGPGRTVEEHLRHLIDRLEPARENLVAIPGRREFSCYLRCFEGDRPELNLPQDLLRRICSFAADLDIDLMWETTRSQPASRDPHTSS